jgi:hypothetical protein
MVSTYVKLFDDADKLDTIHAYDFQNSFYLFIDT